jgi:alpha-amylase
VGVSPEEVKRSEAVELGSFAEGYYESKVRRSSERVQIQLTRLGLVQGREIRITKGITLEAGSAALEIAYLLENLPAELPLHFAIEMNFAGLPSGADDRYFHDGQGNRLGQLGRDLNLTDAQSLHLVDEWLGIDVGLTFNRPTGLWTCPIETVSQSEGGFELVHQSVCVHPHWLVKADAQGRWSVNFLIAASTALAEARMQPAVVAEGIAQGGRAEVLVARP